MTSEFWARVCALFDAAVHNNLPDRDTWLDDACAGDPELRAQVGRLLAHDAQAVRDQFLAMCETPRPSVEPDAPLAIRIRWAEQHILCPHCRNPIELVDLADIDNVVCLGCGSSFRLERQSTAPLSTRDGPRSLGRFELRATIGVGTFGTVYKAYDPVLDRIVALKVPRAGTLATGEARARFLEEGKSTAQLRHPSIVTVHEVGEIDDLPWMANEFIDGITLSDRLTGGTPPPREAARMIAEVADALQYAHERGVIHRDIKPSNIMIDNGGRLHVTDFGVAKRDAGEVTITLDGEVLGTPAYMSPEQARGEGTRVDGRSDVYSLGVVLYEMLTGGLPFRGNFNMMLHQVEHNEPEPPRSLNDRIPRDLETICLKAMAKEPARRYPSARELAEDVKRYLADEPIKARPVGPPGRAWRWSRRNPRLAGALASTAASLVAVAALSVLFALNRSHMLVESNRHLAQANFELGSAACERGEVGPGLHWLLRSLRSATDAGDADWKRLALANLAAWEREYPRLEGVLSHAGPVKYATFSPDGKTALTASYDDTAQLWDVATAQPVGLPLQHNGWVWYAAFSPDGRIAATASLDGKARLWDVASSGLLEELDHGAGVHGLAFSPNGRTLVTAAKDKFARLWDVASGQPKGRALAHMKAVNDVGFSPDGRIVLTASDDTTVRLWDAETGEPLGKALKHNHEVWFAKFSPDKKCILTASCDKATQFGEVRLWEVATGQSRLAFRHEGVIYCVTFSPDGKTVATASQDGTARLWDAVTWQPRGEPLKHDDAVWSIEFSPDGSTVLTASWDCTSRLWDASTGKPRGHSFRHQGSVQFACFSFDGRRILSAGDDRSARIWDAGLDQPLGRPLPCPGSVRAETTCGTRNLAMIGTDRGQALVCDATSGKILGSPLAHGASLTVVALSPAGTIGLTASADGLVRLWNLASGQPLRDPHQFRAGVTTAAFSADGRTAVAASSDGTAQLWNTSTGRLQGQPIRHGNVAITAVSFLDDRTVVTAGADRVARLWDVTTTRPRGRPLPHPDTVIGLAASPDGKILSTACLDGAARLWHVGAGSLEPKLLRHDGQVLAVAFSPPDGRTVLTASYDNTARLWDVASARPLSKPLRHQGKVIAIAFSPHGETAITASLDGTARLWDARLGQPIGPPLQHPQKVRSVSFNFDGSAVVTGCEDGTARIWPIAQPTDEPDHLLARLEARTGLHLDEQTGLQVLDNDTWIQRRRLSAAKSGANENSEGH
jgi:WD40 repeat protein/serine/threonine protein kinase